MALTRPTFNNINTSTAQANFNDATVTLNYGNVSANNQDIGFVFNRGTNSNVAIVWSETLKGFVLAYTTSSGLTAGNISVIANANLQVGNLSVSGITALNSSISATDLVLSGNLTVNGTTTTINSTTVTTNDKTFVLANNQTTSSTVDGSGIDVGGGTPIATWRYDNSTTSWQSNVSITPAATNTLTLGGTGNYWNNIYSTTYTGTTGTFSGTVTAATINAATIGNSGAILTGTLSTTAQTNITSVGTLTGLTLSGALNGTTISAATIGNSGATLTGATLSLSSTLNASGTATVNALVSNGAISGTTGTFTSTITGTTINASTIGNSGATLTGTTVNAATIGNTGATLVGTTANISGNATLAGNVINGNVFATGYFYANGYAFTGGGGGNPGGSTGQIQYNSGGVFTGAAGVITDGSNLTLNAQGDVRFADSDSSNWVAFQAPATIASNVTWTLPAADGSANQALVTNGTGTLSWAAAGAAITDDTSSTTLYPSMSNVTSGYLTDARVSSSKFTFNASTGTITTVAINAATIGNTGATLTGTLQTAAQTNITSVGTLTGLTLSGTLTGTTINAATIGNSGATITGTTGTFLTSVTTATLNAATIGNTGATITGATVSAATSISRNSRNVPTYTAASAAPASPLMGDFWYNSSTDVLYQYIYDGTNSQWVDISSGLQNASTSATANTLALRDASGDLYAVTFRGKATSAQYADLAENYLSDSDYEPGTVVVFGGEKEITVTDQSHDTRVAGVISTAPAYLMNSECTGLPVAFTGRVPCKVTGSVRKGDVLVASDIPGVAQVLTPGQYAPGCVIGKALENKEDTEVSLIEVVVGRF